MEVRDGAIFRRPSRTLAAHRIAQPETSRPGARGQRLLRHRSARLRSLRRRGGRQDPHRDGDVVGRRALRQAILVALTGPVTQNYRRNVSFGFYVAQNKAVGAGLIQLRAIQLRYESWGVVMKSLLTVLCLAGALCFAQQNSSQDMKGMNMPGHDMSKMSAPDSGEDTDASMHAMNSMEGHHMDMGPH